jgi:thiamine-monophosphate kinase
MKRAATSERRIVRELLARFTEQGGLGAVLVGIGDDAAVLRRPSGPLVWTVDSSVEGVHFDLRWLSLADVGARSFHAAVSDVAAMGAAPVAALSSIVLPASLAGAPLGALTRGQAEAAAELRCPIVGGNLSRGGELSVTTTVLGVAKSPLTRAGARPGDEVWLVGDVGLAAAGLAWLAKPRTRRAKLEGPGRRAVEQCVRAWRRPRALIREGRALASRATAAIDVSDGLAGDVGHLAEASEVLVVLDEGALRATLSPALSLTARLLGEDPLALALRGGEDYALVATGPARSRPRSAVAIGRVERGRGVRLALESGKRRRLGGGFDHFAGRK